MAFTIRTMRRDEWAAIAALIHDSTNAWYVGHGLPSIFSDGPDSTTLFCEVYEALDPDCCLVAEATESHELCGSCFYHPRATHVSLGIMNVHPAFFGRGVAAALLSEVVAVADKRQLPVRLVSSALNLDSYSLYNRQGFVPYAVYQDMLIQVPVDGMSALAEPPRGAERVRPAALADAPRMAELERAQVGIERQADFEFFIRNEQGIWNSVVLESDAGTITGFMHAVRHPASNMLGPALAGSESDMIALAYAALEHHRDNACVMLVPANAKELVQAMYSWGARNCELHVGQVRGEHQPISGVSVPTFMPETA